MRFLSPKLRAISWWISYVLPSFLLICNQFVPTSTIDLSFHTVRNYAFKRRVSSVSYHRWNDMNDVPRPWQLCCLYTFSWKCSNEKSFYHKKIRPQLAPFLNADCQFWLQWTSSQRALCRTWQKERRFFHQDVTFTLVRTDGVWGQFQFRYYKGSWSTQTIHEAHSTHFCVHARLVCCKQILVDAGLSGQWCVFFPSYLKPSLCSKENKKNKPTLFIVSVSLKYHYTKVPPLYVGSERHVVLP